jgi:hypothetical protein
MIVPTPAKPPEDAEIPHPLTFFVTRAQRRAILAALRAIDVDRSRALRTALRVERATT